MKNKYFIRYLYISDFIKTIDYYARSLSEKILPSFKDNEVNEEADRIADETYNRIASFSDPEWYDPADGVDQAMDAGVDFYLMAQGIKQGVINIFTAGLHHLFEQQLLRFHRQELLWEIRRYDDLSIRKLQELLKVKEAQSHLLKDYNIDITAFACWGKLEELELVANTVKHADGRSCAQLKQKRPDLFFHPGMNDKLDLGPTIAILQPVYQPLAGEGLYIPLEEFNKYGEATKQFWEELAQAVEGLPDLG